MTRMINVMDSIIAFCLYGIIVVIPFSKAGIEICVSVAIGAWLIKNGMQYRWRMHRYIAGGRFNKPILFLLCISLVSAMTSINLLLSLEGIFLKLLEYVLLFFVWYDYFVTEEGPRQKMKILFYILTVSACVVAYDALYQLITGADFIRGFVARGRLRAAFASANGLAAWSIVIIPLMWGFCFSNVKVSKVYRICAYILSFIYIILLGMTLSRGGWIGFCVACILIGFIAVLNRSKSVKRIASTTLICLFVALVVGLCMYEPVKDRFVTLRDGFEKTAYKKYVWQEALQIIEDFPLLGTGPNTYAAIAPLYRLKEETGYYPHNSYLHMAAETGLLGLAAFLWLIGAFCWSAITAIRKQGDVLLIGLVGGMSAYLVHASFDTHLYSLQLAVLFWVILALGAARITLAERHTVAS